MVAQVAVNHLVVGSSPTLGALPSFLIFVNYFELVTWLWV